MQKIKKDVKNFKKTYGIKNAPTSTQLKDILVFYGFEVYGYKEHSYLVYETQSQDLAKSKYAYTWIKGNKKYVFFDDRLNEIDISRLLAHEIGHIRYNHLYRHNNIFDTDVNKEWEANIFAAYLLDSINYKNVLKKIILITLLALSFFMIGKFSTKSIPTANLNSDNYVYITPDGDCYHAPNCSYGEYYHRSIKVIFSEIEGKYLPCANCNPDKYFK